MIEKKDDIVLLDRPKGSEVLNTPITECRVTLIDKSGIEIVSIVADALRNIGRADLMQEFIDRAFASETINELLITIAKYVHLK